MAIPSPVARGIFAMDRRLSGRTVSITIDLPIELAEYLAEDGMQLIATVQHAVRKFKRNPPPDLAAIAKAEREEKLREPSNHSSGSAPGTGNWPVCPACRRHRTAPVATA